jgi:hypothetical protein
VPSLQQLVPSLEARFQVSGNLPAIQSLGPLPGPVLLRLRAVAYILPYSAATTRNLLSRLAALARVAFYL